VKDVKLFDWLMGIGWSRPVDCEYNFSDSEVEEIGTCAEQWAGSACKFSLESLCNECFIKERAYKEAQKYYFS
jgi:hypothetical protein